MRWAAVLLLSAAASAAWAQDQDFQWARGVGGPNGDGSPSVVVDAAGSVYHGGAFLATADFDSGPGTYLLTAHGPSAFLPDVFIAKFDPAGTLVWARNLGGPQAEGGGLLALDAAGNIYVVGTFNYTADFDPDPIAVYNMTPVGSADVFLVKLDPDGGLIWARQFGGLSDPSVAAIAVDGEGFLLLTGPFQGTADFDPDPGSTYNLTALNGSDDAFVLKLDANAGFVWAKRLGGPSHELGLGIATNAAEDVYTVGNFANSADFDPGPGVYTLATDFGQSWGYISKLDYNGEFVWARSLNGVGDSSRGGAEKIAIDSGGNLILAGGLYGTMDFDPGPGTFNLTAAGNSSDAFVWKLDGDGTFVWAGLFRGTADADGASDVATDALGNVYTVGQFTATADFDPGPAVYNLTAGFRNAFVSKLDAGGQFVWAKSLGGPDSDGASAVRLDTDGNVYLSGYFERTADFVSGAGSYLLTSAGQEDAFVAKLAQTPVLRFSSTTTAAWSPLFGEVTYNVYRSDSGAPGPFVCFSGFQPGSSVIDFEVPAPDSLFAYLVTTVASSGHEGTMGLQAVNGTPTVERPNVSPCVAASPR